MKFLRKPYVFILFGLFFLSGFAGLVYESIWSHYLKLFLGHAAYSQTLVLVIYMGGMAVGSWLCSVYSHKIRNLLIVYALAELIIGFTAIVFHPVFVNYLSFSYSIAIPGLNSSALISLYKWITASLLILPQSILLGATFPLMTGGIIRHFKETPGYTISVLYFVNSLGGSIGVVISGFLLIEKIQLPGTVIFAGFLDVVVAAGVLLLSFSIKGEKEPEVKRKHKQGAADTQIRTEKSIKADSVGLWMFFLAGCTAASSFMYEIGWIRMLSLVLGSSTHAFELMLSAFILGIAIGGFWIRNKLDRFKNPLQTLALIQVIMGVCAILTLVFYSQLFYLMKFLMSTLSRNEQSYIMFNIYSHLICLVVMLPATICIGMTLPVITFFLYKKTNDESVIGKVYAFNTLGSIIGVILAIQLLMPLIGLKGLILTGGSIDMLLGVLVVWYFRKQFTINYKLALTGISLSASILPVVFIKLDPILLTSGVFRSGQIFTDREMVFYKDGKTASVSLHRRDGSYSLAVNGKVDASLNINPDLLENDEYTQILLAVYPLAYAKNVSTVGVIGFGSGMTASVILKSDSVKKMDVVEIEPFVLDAARMMGPKVSPAFNDKRCKIHIDDARTYFSSQKAKYDIIISEPSNPWVSGVANLFSKEFFRLAGNHLTDNGVLAQWFHLYEMSPALLSSVFKSLGEEFQDYKVFVIGADLIILASKGSIRNNPNVSTMSDKNISDLLTRINIYNGSDLASGYIGDKKLLQPLMNSFTMQPNSDYNQILDLGAAKARIMDNNSFELASINNYILPILRIVESWPDESMPYDESRKIPDNMNSHTLAKRQTARQIHYYVKSIGTSLEAHADTTVVGDAALTVAKIRMTAKDPSRAARRPLAKWALDMLEATMPYLSKEQMKEIWGFIEKQTAMVDMGRGNLEVLLMLKAITYEDYAAVKSHSLFVLGKDRINDSQISRLALSALLVASIKTGDLSYVDQVWQRMDWKSPPDVVHTILGSIAAEKIGGNFSVR